MSDRVRDRTLVLRVLSPELQSTLRNKISDAELKAGSSRTMHSQSTSSNSAFSAGNVEDLEGVSIMPSDDGSTLFNFLCDGQTFPARLVNLPCPVEVHKTHDHAMYYKCTDVGQMLVVYASNQAMENAEKAPGYKTEGFPSYYPSGITPPMKKVVHRRFEQREYRAVPPPRAEVLQVEQELQSLILTLSKDPGKASTTATTNIDETKVVEEIEEDIVEYEPYMDDYGRKPKGIIVDEKDKIITTRPEVWLPPETRKEMEREQEAAAQKEAEEAAAAAAAFEEERAKTAAAAEALEAKKSKKATGVSKAASGSNKEKKVKNSNKKKGKKGKNVLEPESSGPAPKKGIASKKSREAAAKAAAEVAAASVAPIDEEVGEVIPPAVDNSIDAAALMIAQGNMDGTEDEDLLGLNDGYFDFSAEGEEGFGDFGL